VTRGRSAGGYSVPFPDWGMTAVRARGKSGSLAMLAAIRRAAFKSVFPTVQVRSVSDAGPLFTGQTGDLFLPACGG
jgi:hypothetical protein